ncbi:hypothetical protein [Nocardia brasiliensis]|uniref:hypothetical protein n=1 Tax=Nocardia brasiliensis TaxID=37326 RepID=UPI00313DA000
MRTDDNRRRGALARATGRRVANLTPTGIAGPGGGRSRVGTRLVEYRATTAQVAGLWPWCVGAGAPILGTPLGPHLETGEPVCYDAMNWFARGKFITAPSTFVLALNGFGKSSLVRRLVTGAMAQGVMPLVLADVKPDYRRLIEQCGGQVIDLGYGHGTWNPLDPGVMAAAIGRLEQAGHTAEADRMRLALRARQTNVLAGLIELVRGSAVADYEETLIATALTILNSPAAEGGGGFDLTHPPILSDLVGVLEAGGDELMLDAVAEDPKEYRGAILSLMRSLRALTRGPYGALFDGQTSVPIDIDSVGIAVDISHLPDDRKLRAAVMLTTWNSGFASIEASNALTAAGLQPQRYFQVVMDELWLVLGMGEFMVARVDELTRLQRGIATELILISHSFRDLVSLQGQAAARALGFLERARVKIFGALTAEEVAGLSRISKLTEAEAAMVTGWSAPQALISEAIPRPAKSSESIEDDGLDAGDFESSDPADPATTIAPGTGNFLLKYTEDASPGIPFHLLLTKADRDSGIHDTSEKFKSFTESAGRL